ncbi:MAG: type IV pilin protein [Dokdonella sp.]
MNPVSKTSAMRTVALDCVGHGGRRGFTLIELMITVAIVAILAAVAFPSYQNQVRKGRRADAKSVMLDLTQQLERRYTTDRDYTNLAAVCGQSVQSPTTGTAWYQVSTVCTPSAYTVTATPQGTQASDPCGTMTINPIGTRTPATAGCW